MSVSSIKSEIEMARQQLADLESELYDAEDAVETLGNLAHLLNCNEDGVMSEVKRMLAIVAFFDEIGVPDDLSLFQMNAIRDAVRKALEA